MQLDEEDEAAVTLSLRRLKTPNQSMKMAVRGLQIMEVSQTLQCGVLLHISKISDRRKEWKVKADYLQGLSVKKMRDWGY